MYRIPNFFIFLFFLFFQFTFSQELPPVNIFYERDYGAEKQNWAISQANNQFIYVANNKGLLEYNGASWQLYETPNETIIRSVKVYDTKIFTGFYMDFGFWKKNDFGCLAFTSIVSEAKIEMLEDEQIWEIVELDGWMLFKSLERIYLYNLASKNVKIINAENKLHKLSRVEDVVYFQEAKKGLFKIENGAAKLISDDIILKNSIVVSIFKEENKLLILTQKQGFFYLENGFLKKWKNASEEFLKDKTIYSAIHLQNNDFVLGTISNGIICLDKVGAVKYQTDQSSGLSNNTVLSIFEDKKNNIWLGLDNGINCINNSSAFKIYNKRSKFSGTIYTSIVYNNKIYLGTNQGLFFREKDSKRPFQFVKNTQGQVWSLQIIEEVLFCGHDSGTFIINNNEAKNIFNTKGTWLLKKITKNKILQGSYDGLYVLEKKNGIWKLKNKIEGFKNSSKFFVLEENTVYLNHEYKGVFKITLDENLTKAIAVEKEDSIEKGIHSSIIKYQNKILYTTKKGVFIYNNKTQNFRRDSVFSKLVTKEDYISGRLIKDEKNDRLWLFSKNEIRYLSPSKFSKQPEIKKIIISESIAKAASGYENIIHLDNSNYLIGISNGYIVLDLKNLKQPEDFNIYLNKIANFQTNKSETIISLSENTDFAFNNNNLEFFYSVPNFNKVNTTFYQYQLLGFNQQWSSPSKENSVLFENISSGNYTFKVRAIIGGKISKNEATYSFVINRPWQYSNGMIVFYFLLALIILYTSHLLSRRYYRKQRKDFLEKAKKDTELKELEISQQLIKLNNDKLRHDIESKNKELATSTMNMIKKNEFLNTIKTELTNGGERNISKVVRIIDKNLNNTNDWTMFQEAFNNADKNFLKKMKEKHPKLTPNDLRLCAYLRLNLSSKEIAPLLNISPRSVEVKRYRLRKKMDLPHDSNLTNYILDI